MFYQSLTEMGTLQKALKINVEVDILMVFIHSKFHGP